MEKWKAVVGFEGLYEVSDMGNVKSLERQVARKNGQSQIYPEKILKPLLKAAKRRSVCLSRSAVNKHYQISRLVLEAFVGPRPEGMVAAHNNGDCTDDRLVNLRYATYVENEADKVLHGTRRLGEQLHNAKLDREKVLAIRELVKTGLSQKEIGKQFGVSQRTVSLIKRRENWAHV